MLHHAFLEDTLAGARHVGAELVVAWALEPGEPVPAVEGARGGRQVGADLGARLAHTFEVEGRDGSAVVIMGSDHPDFDPAQVEAAFSAFASGADVVLGPSTDGGYWLVGCAPGLPVEALFADTAWSTSAVFVTTSGRCRSLGLELATVGVIEDVDTPADLDRLITRLAGLEQGRCPATRRVLDHLLVEAGG